MYMKPKLKYSHLSSQISELFGANIHTVLEVNTSIACLSSGIVHALTKIWR